MTFRALFGRSAAGARLDDDLGFHLDKQIAENIAAGMNVEAARYAAVRSFGNQALLREQTRARRGAGAGSSLCCMMCAKVYGRFGAHRGFQSWRLW